MSNYIFTKHTRMMMGIRNIASGQSVALGLDYYKKKKVIKCNQVSENNYEGLIQGKQNKYQVSLDIKHPRKSKCNCPHAKDRRVICKHIIALYFEIFPKEVTLYLKEMEEAEKEYEEYQKELEERLIKYIKKMSKKELEHALLDLLNDSPDWIYDRFIRDSIGF